MLAEFECNKPVFLYNVSHYKEPDQSEVLQFMRDHPFVFLMGCDHENKPAATQVPVFMDERDGKFWLTGHIMRNTDHHKAFLQNANVLALFNGPHAYVSASWYSNPHQASTWNYMSVHAKGKIRFGEEEELVAILKRLTLHYEKNNSGSSTVYDNLPPAYKEPLLKAIVPFEIAITGIEHVFKLSQNRDQQSYENIIQQLQQQEGDAKVIASVMEKRKSKLFPQ
ncbi:MAG: hypothetical protein GC171_12040 [Terrimonas sp.]|nr:hypothetical protein [Terrimonas sp.]